MALPKLEDSDAQVAGLGFALEEAKSDNAGPGVIKWLEHRLAVEAVRRTNAVKLGNQIVKAIREGDGDSGLRHDLRNNTYGWGAYVQALLAELEPEPTPPRPNATYRGGDHAVGRGIGQPGEMGS